jgi:hypothetical protein
LIRNVLPLAAILALTFSAAAAHAQENPVTALDKQLSRIDLGVSGAGIFNKSTSGPVVATGSENTGQVVGNEPSNTLGALVTVRYVVKPLVGLEFNYGFARYTENFSNVPGIAPSIGVQTKVNEYTIGYLVMPAHAIFGYKPFISAGAGTMEFKPTPGGGLGFPTQARATYYYSAGIQQEYFSEHFGFRASFRENFFLAPDYGQNFLTIKQHTTTISPTLGFYLKF